MKAGTQGEERGTQPRRLFGDRVIQKGLATPDQVAKALRVQAERTARGAVQNLGEILMEQGVLTAAQVKSVLEERDQVIMTCPGCGERYNVSRSAADRATCPADGKRLAAGAEAAKVGVSATLSASPTADDAPVGLEIGRCRILEFLGKGAMGAVYKARHLPLNRFVAVKLIPPASRDSTFIRRLLVEAQTVARLEHPNIVQVYDVGFEKSYFFMVMQYLQGVTLEKHLARHGIPPFPETLEIVRHIGRGLEAAHGMGVIHRDVKPSNIFLTDDGRARLTDFGLALMTESKDDLGAYVVGTPGYMSPEQYLGNPVDARSDLYSLGIIFYRLATGSRPFTGNTVKEVREAQLAGQPKAPRSINPDISEGAQAIMAKLMARSPERRYGNAAAFLEDLERVLCGQDPKALLETGRFVKCGFCETLNRGKVTRCKVCGEALGAGPEVKLDIALRPGEFRCRECRALNPPGARACSGCQKLFCPACGNRPFPKKGPCACGTERP